MIKYKGYELYLAINKDDVERSTQDGKKCFYRGNIEGALNFYDENKMGDGLGDRLDRHSSVILFSLFLVIILCSVLVLSNMGKREFTPMSKEIFVKCYTYSAPEYYQTSIDCHKNLFTL